MNKTLTVARYELVTTVMTFTFLFTVLGLPLISGLVYGGIAALNKDEVNAAEEILSVAVGESEPDQFREIPDGYVDQSGLIHALPASVGPGALRGFADEASARQALDRGQIRAYYLVPENYLSSGELVYVQSKFNPVSAYRQAQLMGWVLRVNLLGGDEQLAAQIESPMDLDLTILEPRSGWDESNPLGVLQPYLILVSFFMINTMSASSLLFSIRRERDNRSLEILISSLNSRQLLTGKLIGQGLASLLRTVMWAGTGYVFLKIGGRALQVPQEFQLQPLFLVWVLVFFLLGYALYASLMAGVGALAPYLREIQYATMFFFLPLMIPVFMFITFIQDPNGPWATGLSLFPLTAPIAMLARLASTNDVPVWQVFLSAGLLVMTAFLVLRATAGLFRAQILLAGETFSLRRLAAALGGRG
jgi:ABC-2 type transport system permease protein